MDTNNQMQIFFIISSVGFVLVWILIAILLYYLIRLVRTSSRVMGKIEKDIDTIGDTTRELLEDLRDSTILKFFFRKKKKSHKE